MTEGAIPATAATLRRHNTARVLRALRDHGPLSRSDLARRTGLAKATVGTIVADLHAAGVVREHETAAPSRGRPSRPLGMDGSGFVAIGVDVNVDYMSMVALDLSRRTVASSHTPHPGPGPTSLDAVAAYVDGAAEAATGGGRTLLGVTVAVPGLVDPDGCRVTYAPNLRWNDVDVGSALRASLGSGVALRIENDANCAALGETMCGVARGHDDIVYLTGTVGIGGGLLSGGAIAHGGLGYAGEVGHMPIGDRRAVCGCGRSGCWEAVVGLRAMLRAVGADEAADEDPVAIAERVAARADADGQVRTGLGEVAGCLASGASVLANALSPQMIVLGGYFVPLGAWLLPPVRAALASDVFAGPGCRAELSTLGLGAAATGAAAQTLADVYAARVPLPG